MTLSIELGQPVTLFNILYIKKKLKEIQKQKIKYEEMHTIENINLCNFQSNSLSLVIMNSIPTDKIHDIFAITRHFVPTVNFKNH